MNVTHRIGSPIANPVVRNSRYLLSRNISNLMLKNSMRFTNLLENKFNSFPMKKRKTLLIIKDFLPILKIKGLKNQSLKFLKIKMDLEF